MKKIYLLLVSMLLITAVNGQESNSILFGNVGKAPVKHDVTGMPTSLGPKNNHQAHKETSGVTSYSDWYDLWDEMNDSGVSKLYAYDIYPDSNLLDSSFLVYSQAYYVFTHGLGMSFDPSDSAYFYHAFHPAYRVSAPFMHTRPYVLDSFWMPGEYLRYDTTSSIVDSLIIEFTISQKIGTPPPDSGAYALNSTTPNPMYHPCTADNQPRFATPRYFRALDECIDPVLTTTTHQRYAFPLTVADGFYYRTNKFGLPAPLTVLPGKYLSAYAYFKSQVAYPLGTNIYKANLYWLYAGEPGGANVWFPQSAHNTTISYPGSYQDGLIATSQIRYNDAGFVFNGHNVLLSSYAYANAGPDYAPGFDVPYMSFHINWTTPPPADAGNIIPQAVVVNAFPNPAGDELNILFTLEQESEVHISLINAIGQVVATRDLGNKSNGNVVFNTAMLPAGIYIYVLQSKGCRASGKVFLTH